MKALFWTEKDWHAGISAAVIAGLTFDAYAPGCGYTTWTIEYTGGY